MPRLFTGIEIPPELRARLASLRSPLPGAKWVETDNLHITLRFAGDIDNRTAQEVRGPACGHRGGLLRHQDQRSRAFGGNDPKILWAGVEAGPELASLARASERAARSAGLPPEARAFKAHITLARMRHARVDVVAKFLERNGRFSLPSFRVERFVLFSSRPKVGGGPYALEEAYPLIGAIPEAYMDPDAIW